MVQNPPATVEGIREAVGSLGQEDPPGGGHGNPLQDSCLENLMDRGAWWATAHGVTESAHTGPYYGPSTTLIVDLYKYLI